MNDPEAERVRLEVSEKLRRWLEDVSNTGIDPWKDQTENELPISKSAKPIDPTQDFTELSDLLSDSSSCEESSLEGEEIDSFGNYTYRGYRDEKGLFHSNGVITFENGDIIHAEFNHGIRNGEGIVISPRSEISRLIGTYIDGKLQGKGQVISSTTSISDCFFKDGVIHGPVRRIDLKKFREFRRQLGFVGTYLNGVPGGGPCWLYKEGGGYLYGNPNSNDGEFTGDDLAYIYPDLYTCYVGSFQKGLMINAVEGTIKSAELSDENIMQVTFSLTDENSANIFGAVSDNIKQAKAKNKDAKNQQKPIKKDLMEKIEEQAKNVETIRNGVNFSLSTRTYIGDQSLRPDPYENRLIECRTSEIANSGLGLYAKCDLAKDTIVAFYNGVRLPFELLGRPPEDWATSGYKIHVNADFISGLRMDIPPEYIDLSEYCATLGHKMNHSFKANCFAWFFDHPRFGIIPCEKATRLIKKGEELTLDYEYDLNNCPEWFKEAFNFFLENNDEEIIETIHSKYLNYRQNS